MDAASVLKVLVSITGVKESNRKLDQLEQEMRKAQRAGNDMGSGLTAAGRGAQSLTSDLEKTRAASNALGSDLGKVSRAVDDTGRSAQRAAGLWQDSTGRWRNAAGQFATAAGRAKASVDGAGDGVRGLGDETSRTTSALSRASQVIKDATVQLDETGGVSASTRRELNNLGSRGVAGLESDMGKMTRTLQRAESELDKTGSLSRRTARDLENLGGAGGGGGLAGLQSALAGFGGGGLSALGAAAAATVPAMIALSGEAVALAAALAPLAGLAGAAAVGVSAAGQAFGVVKLATIGLSDALKEQFSDQAKTAAGAVSAASQQRAAAAQITSAQDQVRQAHEQVHTAAEAVGQAEWQASQATQGLADAQRQAKDAQQALSAARVQARRDLQDMHDALQAAMIGEQRAILDLQDAKAALAQTLAGASPEDITKAQQAVTEAAHSQEQATINLQRAQATYDQVVADSTSTDLDKAQALADLHQAQDAVTDATTRQTDAQNQLSKLQAGPSGEDKKKAMLAVADASQRVTDAERQRKRAAQDTAAADRAGVEGSQQVVRARQAVIDANRAVVQAAHQARQADQAVADAERRLADAHRNVTRALRRLHDAQLDAHDSAMKTAGASQTLNKAMDALPAPAQAFVRQLVAMKPRLNELRATAAAGLFPGLGRGLMDAAHNFDPVEKVVGLTARALGNLGERAGELVGSKGFGKDIQTVGARNAKIIGTVGDGALHLADALRHIIVAAGPLTSWLARMADGWAKNVDAQAKAGRENGRLADFFDRTRTVVAQVVSILGHLGSGLMGVGRAGTDAGNGILKSIGRAADRFDEWSNSVNGQNSLKRFFADSRELIANLIPVLKGVGKATASIGFGPLNTALKLAGPHAQALAYAFLAYKVAATVAAVASKGLAAAEWALNVAMDANPVGAVVLAITALTAGLVVAYEKVGWFHKAVDSVFGWIKDHWPLLVGIFLSPIALAVIEIIKHWDDLIGFFKSIPGRVIGALKATPGLLVNAGRWMLDRVVDGFKTITALLASIAGWLRNRVLELVHTEADALKGLGSWVLNRIVDGFKVITDLLKTVGGWLRNRIVDFIHAEIAGLNTVGSWVLNRVVDGFTTVTKALAGAGDWVLKQIRSVIHGLSDGFTSLGGWIIDRIVDGLKSGASALLGFVIGIVHAINKLPFLSISTKGLEAAQSKLGDNGKAKAATANVPGHFRGGKVTTPMAIVGEEAPRHPEYVIPTNPAYRGRALGLMGAAMRDLGLPGFAQGGVLSFGQLEQVWTQAGGNPAKAAIMAHIAEAESGGWPLRNYGEAPPGTGFAGGDGGRTIAAGLWQILGLPFPGNVYNALTNARMAVAKSSNGANLHPWDASRGVWEKFLGASASGSVGTSGGGILGALQSAGGFLLDAPGKLLDAVKAAMPDVGSLPGWINGSWLIDRAMSWVKDQVSGVFGGGGGAMGPAGAPGVTVFDGKPVASWIARVLAWARQHGWAGSVTSGYRTAAQQLLAAQGYGLEHYPNGPLASNHTGTAYPSGAVDVTMAAQLNSILAGWNSSHARKLIWGGPVMGDWVHFSATGHAIGGILGKAGGPLGGQSLDLIAPYAGSFSGGGVVPGPVGAPRTAIVHGGEVITDPRVARQGPLVNIEHMEVTDGFSEDRLARQLARQIALESRLTVG